MDAQATEPPSSSYPPWVLFEPYADVDTTGSYSTAADPNTLAVARTSSDHPIGVSLSLALPPAESRVCFHFPRRTDPPRLRNEIIAAHGDSMLVKVTRESYYKVRPDYFVYNAGNAAANSSQRPPSLLLLPPGYHYLDKDSTGLLRRGEDDLVVANLKMVEPKDDDTTPKDKQQQQQHVAEMTLLRSGKWWTLRWSRITGIEKEKLRYWISSRCVIPVGDDTLCWIISMHEGLIFCKVYEERPVLQYVPLPEDPRCSAGYYSSWNVCVTSGGNAVKFVNRFARCCCGGAGASKCKHSEDCYVIKTWTLRMDSMTWVVDGMMDSTELWAHDSYKGLPRLEPGFPVVSMDEPHIICFMLQQSKDWWLIMLDMRSKILRSIHIYEKANQFENVYPGKLLMPSKVSYYFNSCPSRSSQIDIGPPDVASLAELQTYDAKNSKPSCRTSADPGMQASEILEALQEISSYGLPGDDMRKAVSILSHANGRRFRSFLVIPKNMRKDWLLTEINAPAGM
ncbi:hypothetical protein HU200_033121 [Digitaria exilis]|uniref:DUF1618 domain-containing protein n=1 Tax=Digitaria exilis TaxID=1010633 RepID=A0A835BI91_9POAL|nr:hypothetical protein HU200_033121 [Digitaria exilis]